ncbi:conserved hypothetical protein [Ricinus communis]|uniref:C3H1-type domain-containing protein n=1 Tax=Ricinus communis TaxID=3988 RepID=B9SW62_RICCO|nr:conserved hypothetical protein [Ricinus communis]
MVAATQQQQQQQATASALSAEEEALKRNTDCVYFLASPLTCKKGSECEYRHSEYARVNPRDCYYWLNGSCLNPKCGFRHPPLDGLFGIQAATSAGPSLPQSQKVAAPAVHAPQNPGKQAVPCIFFQKGFCLKGDRCAFVHGPSPTSNKISQPVGPSAGTELPPQTKAYGGPQKLTQDQRTPQANFSRAVEASTEAKLASKSEIGSRRDVVGVERNLPPSKSMDVEVAKYKVTDLHPVVNGNSSRFNRLHQSQVPDDQNFQNGKDVDELLRESSPGFDVLVDDELRNSDFYHGEDQYGRTTGPEGRNLNPVGSSSNGSDLRVEREIDKGRSRGRLSPGRSQIPSHQGRLRDRIKGRVEEDYDSEGRSIRGNRMRREMTDDRNTDFAAPKSLAELKGTKSIEGVMQQSLGKRKQLGDHQPSEGDLSFEGPMPLSEILKRKRQAGVAASGSASSFNKHDDNQKESKEGLPGSPNNAAVTEIENGPSFVKNEANRQVLKDDDVPKSATAVENTEVDLGQCSQLPNQSEPETEDGMIVDDGVEEEEYEVDDQGEGDYEYEQGDEGEYYEEGENAEGEEEYVDENEEFAKKLGVVFT